MNSADERAAIVAWLRGEALFHLIESSNKFKGLRSQLSHEETSKILSGHTDAIERGEHLNQGKQETDD